MTGFRNTERHWNDVHGVDSCQAGMLVYAFGRSGEDEKPNVPKVGHADQHPSEQFYDAVASPRLS